MTLHSKVCTGCNLEVPLDGFHADKNRPDGRRSMCKVCRKKNNPSKAELEARDKISDPDVRWTNAKQRAIKQIVNENEERFKALVYLYYNELTPNASSRWTQPHFVEGVS